jgi:hypothetical protein
MLTETLLSIPSLLLVDVLQRRPLIGCSENSPKSTFTGVFRYNFGASQAASCLDLQV